MVLSSVRGETGCCSHGISSGKCASVILPAHCNNSVACESYCGGNWGNFTFDRSLCTANTIGTVIKFTQVQIPSYVVRPPPLTNTSNVTSGRRLLAEFTSAAHGVAIARSIPGIGFFATLFTPEYTIDPADIANMKAGLDRLSTLVEDVANEVANVADLLSEETRLRLQADAIQEAAQRATNDEVKRVKDAAASGIAANMRSIIQLQSGVGVTRQENLFYRTLDNNVEVMRLLDTSESAQKLGKILGLGIHDPGLAASVGTFEFKYYATTWMYAWGSGIDSGSRPYFTHVAVFSEITVRRTGTALEFLTDGDTGIWSHSVKRLLYGQGKNTTRHYCYLASVTECASEYIANCRNDPTCYAKNEPVVNFNTSGGSNYIPWFNHSVPYKGPEDIGINGLAPDCNYDPFVVAPFNRSCCNRRSGWFQDPIVCDNNCPSYPANRACDLKLDVIGARLTTVWLPTMVNDPFIRSFESMGGRTLPLEGFVPYMGKILDFNVSKCYPHATDFHDPYYIAKLYWNASATARTISSKAAALLASGNRQDNIVYAHYGDMITVDVGFVVGSVDPIVVDPLYYPASASILAYVAGSVPFSGYTAQSGCQVVNGTLICSCLAPGIATELVPALRNSLDSLLPEGYRPLALYAGLQSVRDAEAALRILINDSTISNDILDGLEANRNASILLMAETAAVKARAEATAAEAVQFRKDLNALQATGGGAWWVWLGVAFCITAFVLAVSACAISVRTMYVQSGRSTMPLS